MDTDSILKTAFLEYAPDLLPLVGDEGARFESADSVELPGLVRRADCVLKLALDGGTYYRHLEFQGQRDPEMPWRCLEYGSRLVLHHRAPVLTTVVYLYPEAAGGDTGGFRLNLGGRVANEWRYQVLKLWEVEARRALETGLPGLMSLLPLMDGGRELPVIERAVHSIERATAPEKEPAALRVLMILASSFYDVGTLERLFGRELMMKSSIYDWALEQGLEKGREQGLEKGALDASRRHCLGLIRELHPGLFARALPVVEACADIDQLERWMLLAARGSFDEVAHALGLVH
jgi:predicted transposase YdaD